MFLTTLLTTATLLFTPVDDSVQGRCTSAETILKVFTEHNLSPTKIEGEQLAAFNRAYEAKTGRPAPEGVSALVLIQKGPQTRIITFDANNCATDVMNGSTELVQELLGSN